ncbi:GntR family transcriptional regulator [Azorhizobium oxalatiphilum]|uniref:GntR family transcriptional regulator n=1 Tax=Azorhizobium oxalatiphilum TaxID=980631 RepID=A0A917BW99_9HYPH|nr:PLP-dependent aminotransferase family protein [Azorhizobium oxalatiphilum]GGF58133.1 GntR family transcriptional regulator [Azorhizobium oxalatiphilum]
MDALVEELGRRIAASELKAGEKMASVRKGAERHGVSKNTMAEVYDRLVATGQLEARPGSGYYVISNDWVPAVQPRPHVAEALDLVSLLREQLDHHYELRPGDGRPPASWMEGSEIGAQFARAGKPHGAFQHGYGSSRGFLPLREQIAQTLNQRGIRCDDGQVLMTHGANHALDLIMRHFLEPGDTAFVDTPGYYPLFGKLRLGKVRLVGVRRLPDGPDLADLEAKLAVERPKVFFTQSLAHNPTGATLSLTTAYGLLRLAEQYGFTIVEDDPFADLLPPASPRLAGLDQLNRVLYVGTFSKTLSASLRVGFVAARRGLADALADIKLVTGVATSEHVERLVHGLIANGHYLRHLRRLRSRIESATIQALADLSAIGFSLSPPRDCGFYLWLEMPPGTDEEEVCRLAAERSIFLAPSNVFRTDRQPGPAAFRINVAYASHPQLLDFLSRFGTRA